MNAEIVTELLELENMHVDHAWNGEEAVERYMESAPGTYMAVLMDVQMPGMNGYEAAKAIRAQKSSRPDAGEIPIYAMTANAYTEDISAALNAGMNGHIAKPVDTVALYRLLKKSMLIDLNEREDSHIFRNTYVTGRPQTGRNLYRGYCTCAVVNDTCQRAFSGILFCCAA